MSADEFQPKPMTPGNNLLVALVLISCLVLSTESKGGKASKRKKTNEQPSQMGKKASGASSAASASPNKRQQNSDFSNLSVRPPTHEERLLAFLFDEQEYKSVARAVMDTSKTVTVAIDFVLLRIHGLDERLQILTTTGLVIAEWTDDRLTWDPADFGNLTNIIITADKLWLPELAVMNGADELMPDFDRIRVLLHSDGRLHWEPGGIFRTTCDIDIAYFPFDSQVCPLLIGAYSYHSTRMNITNASSAISTHDFRINGEWHVASTSAHWDITVLQTPGDSKSADRFNQQQKNENGTAMLNETEFLTINYTEWSPPVVAVDGYSHVVFTLNLKRRYKYYIMNIVLPCVMLSVLIMIGFCLSPDAGEKISLGISVLLAFTVFLLMITEWIPRTSLAVPLIVTYLMTTMTLGTVSVCMTVLVLNAHHRSPTCRDVPPWIRQFVLVYLARLVHFQTTQLSLNALSSSEARRQRTRRPPNHRFRLSRTSPQRSAFSYPTSPAAVSNSTAHQRCPDSDIWQRRCRYSYLDQDGTGPGLNETSTVDDGVCSVTLASGASESNHVGDHLQQQANQSTASPTNNGPITKTAVSTSMSLIPPPPMSSTGVAAVTSHRNRTGFRSMAFDCQLRRKLQRSKPSSSPSSSWTKFTPHSVADNSRSKLVGLRLSHFATAGSSDDSPSAAVATSGTELQNERNNWAAAAAAASKRFRAARCVDSDPDDCTADEDDEPPSGDMADDVTTDNSAAVVKQNGSSKRKSHEENRVEEGVEEWHEVARVLDRAFFWLLFGLMTFSGGAILLYPKYSGYDDSWG